MNNKCNSKNNSDKSVNNNDKDSNNITFLILENNIFFTSCLKVFKLMFLFIELGNLFQTEGPIYERLFCPMVVLRKGTLSLA